jgi:hypothetical protein
MRIRKPVKLLVAVTALALSGVLAACSGSPHPSAACRAAVARQNAFVESAIAQGYPDVDISLGLAIQAQDLKITGDALKVCPGSVKIEVLPDPAN